ncbi:PRC-barrel domain-containing protein [Paraburkholderia pallida]|uniref:PRC-barrel domain containing protein n=1 Tax=Paraburkholderia pallida TaxID=2547399 RepID=A0A4P7D5T9_9BURK|nr:PRC-barrel domain-containing protein [Paraburkholderia pallida]QBR04089.1 PRC-barrel domain containing protein [Paraburkholderia pallida]
MLRSIKDLHGCDICASDGEIGGIYQVYFDDETWGIRYLVVETGNWLHDRQVLVSPYSLKHVDWSSNTVYVNLTRQQVRDSPTLDTHKPVSRQHEIEYLRYYSYPTYWDGPNLWGMGAWPAFDPVAQRPAAPAPPHLIPHVNRALPDVHLRSTDEVKGYHIETTDGTIGHVSGFIFDDRAWVMRYLKVDTRNWWPGGRPVLIATRWIELVDWFAATVSTSLTRDTIQRSPAYDDATPVHRSYEVALHEFYNREGYWSEAGALPLPRRLEGEPDADPRDIQAGSRQPRYE